MSYPNTRVSTGKAKLSLEVWCDVYVNNTYMYAYVSTHVFIGSTVVVICSVSVIVVLFVVMYRATTLQPLLVRPHHRTYLRALKPGERHTNECIAACHAMCVT